MKRRAPLFAILLFTFAVASGCTSLLLRPELDTTSLDEATRDDSKLISRFTHAYGLKYVQVEAVALVTGLDGTGSDPPPTPQRAALLDEMKRHNVDHPNALLASSNTSLALVRAYLRPGMQKGDKVDVEVRLPSRSETTSLRNGWVMPVQLTEHAVLGNQMRKGHVLAKAVGAVLVDPSAEEDEALATRGRILGGAVATKDRPMGLIISHENKSVRLSKEIASAINQRFSTYRDGRKTGLAKPKTDEFIELIVHPRYKDNLTRFTKVVRNIAVGESTSDQQQRLRRLATQLMDPLTTANAAIRLEAIGGEQAIDALKLGAAESDTEVRFYSAEALAYLDQTDAVEPLAQAARDEPAFRVNALAALSAMDDVVAYEALRSLLEVRSAETRYGAFRALWSMTPNDALVRGERLGDQFSYHQLDVNSPPMIHITRSFRPEIVMFGRDQQFQLPMVLDAGKHTLVNGLSGTQVTVSRFTAGQPTQKRVVSTSVDEVIRAIVELGGSYPDVVQALQQARKDGALVSSLRVDALPEPGRTYDREDADKPLDPEDAGATPYKVATPLPDLFSRKK
ncbi:MAG: flagellar basal body P-ring protein FlgI [Planctomycetota bacterium]